MRDEFYAKIPFRRFKWNAALEARNEVCAALGDVQFILHVYHAGDVDELLNISVKLQKARNGCYALEERLSECLEDIQAVFDAMGAGPNHTTGGDT